MCLNSIRMASKSLVRSLPKKFEDALLASKPYCVAAEGAPVFEDIGGVVAYGHFPRPAGPHFPDSLGHIKRTAQ